MTETPQVLKRDFVIDEASVLAWAEFSGDYNKLHVDEEFAATTRYGRRIAHGQVLASHISEWVTTIAGQRWTDSGEIRIRFQGPVFFPTRIATELTLTRDLVARRRIGQVVCLSESGDVVLTAAISWADAA